jgi:protoporphyrinogen/coproporphyrinogen III oxidase
LQSDFVAGDRKADRYILKDGILHRAPLSPTGLIGSRIVGVKSKLRILTEVLGSSHPPCHEETLADFVQRKFGAEVLDYLVDPFISTIFFADPHKMGMSAFPSLVEWEQDHGSLVRGAIRARKCKQRDGNSDAAPTARQSTVNGNSLRVTDALPALGSFTSGMARLPERLAEVLREEIRYGARVSSVEKALDRQNGGGARWVLRLATGETIATEDLILAVPAYVAGQLLAEATPELALQLNAIEYAPLSVVSCAYNRSQVDNPLAGFGFMVPRREGLRTICTFWNSSLFPHRAPEGKLVMTSFARGRTPDDVRAADSKELVEVVQTENAKILGIHGEPVERMCWSDSRALPQSTIGHGQRVVEIERIVGTALGLHLSGNFLKGRSIGDCVDLAFRIAENCAAASRANTSKV